MDFRPHPQVLEYQLQHQNNNCLCCASYSLEFNSRLQKNNKINWIISILPINIQTFLMPRMNPLSVDVLKSSVFWLSLIKNDKKNHTWPKKFVASINDVLVYYLKHS